MRHDPNNTLLRVFGNFFHRVTCAFCGSGWRSSWSLPVTLQPTSKSPESSCNDVAFNLSPKMCLAHATLATLPSSTQSRSTFPPNRLIVAVHTSCDLTRRIRTSKSLRNRTQHCRIVITFLSRVKCRDVLAYESLGGLIPLANSAQRQRNGQHFPHSHVRRGISIG